MSTLAALIVEDDAASAKLVAVVLGAEGFATQVVRSAEEALEAIDVALPDVIVLDLVLPLMNGFLLAKLLKARDATRHIPIIAVTAFNGQETTDAALAAGCACYVRKPIDTASFPELVKSHMGGRS
jgi:CheY-like chemotaxis protein